MLLVARKKFHRVAALLSLPLTCAAPIGAWAQDAEAVDPAAPLAEPAPDAMPIVGARAVAMSSSLVPYTGLIRTFEGEVNPHTGLIRTFGGDLTPYTGLIRTFQGNVDPQTGLIRTFEGGIDPYTGLIRTFEGEIDPLTGLIRTFEGEVDPLTGLIRTFDGNVTAQTGLIRTFAGDIDPYTGLIRTFWGSLTPQLGDLDPKIGLIRTFSDDFLPQSRTALNAWAAAQTSGDYAPLSAELRSLEENGAAQWGSAVQKRTGKSFAAGFSQPFFAKWGIDLGNEQTLAGWSSFDRQRVLLDWYDNVLLYSGMDRVDHWMNAVHWNPLLTQDQGSGSRATIGLIDFFAADPDVRSKVIYAGGYQNVSNTHGAAVGSLLVASHDNRGVMGIAPRAQIAAFNPFDQTMTASWADVRAGIAAVGKRGASVINLSLGVPGYTLPAEWRDMFRNTTIQAHKDQSVYVIAAGNDGIVQPGNVNMKDALASTFIVVGSVDPFGRISAFSNTPGTACLTDGTTCRNTQVWNSSDANFRDKSDYLKESGLLMNRFIVAPGEMILVSDGAGGVTRMSGTSFATPLVSGAIALIHDRWPWLKSQPRDVAKVILESAQDLGVPGVDPIYGHGLLDIQAAQSPLDYSKLRYYLADGLSVNEVQATQLVSGGLQSAWSANDMFFVAFEKLANSERDFLIPLSSRLFGTSVNGVNFQEFAYNGLTRWLGQTSGKAGFSDSTTTPAMMLGNGWNMAMRGRTEAVPGSKGGERVKLVSSVELSNPESGIALGFGTGDGAVALGGGSGLQRNSDFNPSSGGANPLLGFASGDAHISARFAVARKLDVSLGLTRQDRGIEQDLASGQFAAADRLLLGSARGYHSQATMARLDYRPARPVTLSLSYTRLAEDGAFFGVRSLDRADFGEATVSDGLTLAVDAQLGGGLSLFASGTMSRSNSQGTATLGIDAAVGTAFQAGFAKQAVLGNSDQLRLTLAQPLTVERGHIDMKMVGVVDRETGERGVITQRVAIGAPEQRRYRMEAFYGADLMEGTGSLGLFGTAELRDTSAEVPAFTVGGNLRLAF
jgi:subtilisin family serine protease